MGVVLDAAGVHQEAGLARCPTTRPPGGSSRSAMPVTSAVRRGVQSLDVLGDLLETDGVRGDEVVIEPVVLDHQVQDAVEQRDVAAGLDRQEQVAGAGDAA